MEQMSDRELLSYIINQQARIDELEIKVLAGIHPAGCEDTPPFDLSANSEYITNINGIDIMANHVRFLIGRIRFYISTNQRTVKISLIKDMRNEFDWGLKDSKDIVEVLTGCDVTR